jgi:flagellin
MVVKNNMSAVSTLNTLNKNSAALAKSLQKVSSGMKINSAADDASGYAISERMRVQIRGLDQANQNTQNGSSMMKVAEGAVSSTVDILKTLKEKAINAASDTNTDSDRQTIQKELNQSIDQIDDNANVTYNGKYLVDGSKGTKGNATYTALTNQALSEDTKATTALTDLKRRAGDSLEIDSTDKVTVSYVQAGKTYTTTFDAGTKTLKDLFDQAEAINADDSVFATATNKSVLAANGQDADAVSADTIAAAKTALDTAQTTMDTQDKALATHQKLKDALDAATTTLGSMSATGTNPKASNGAVKDAEGALEAFTKIIADAAVYGKISSEANGSSAAATNATAYATNLTNAYTALTQAIDGLSDTQKTAAQAALTGTTEGKALMSAMGKLASANDTYTKASADYNADTFKAEDYSKAVTGLEKAKAAYEAAGVSGVALLTGANVGLNGGGNIVATADGTNAITVTAQNSGVAGQISGFNISVSDSEGNVKKSVNAALDSWKETVRAQNQSDDNAITLQVGTNANQSIKVGLTDMRSEALGLKGSDGTKLNISTQAKANAAVNVLDNALQKALDQQTTIGSVQSRLSYTRSNLTAASENVQSSESTIRDADMAKEMTEYTKNNVLLQAAQSMLAQANQSSSSVLSLLQ